MPKNIFTKQEAKQCGQLFDSLFFGIEPKVPKDKRQDALQRIAAFLDAAIQQAPDELKDPEV